MKIESYKKVQAAVAAGIGMAVAVGALQNNLYLVVGAVLAGVAVMLFSSRKVEGKVADEMAYRMAEKASYRAYQLFVVAAAAVAIVSMATDWLNWIPGIGIIGQTLAYSALALMLLYALFYSYYSRKGIR